MSLKQLAEFLALADKIKIEFDPNLTEYEKELWKQLIDELKRQIP